MRNKSKSARHKRWHSNDERGASTVEFALVLPVLAVFLFAIVDFGMVFSGYETMRSGVEAGARAASVNQTGPTTCTGGPGTGSATTEMVCLIVARIGRTLGIKANSLQVGIALPVNTGPDEAGVSNTSGQVGDNVEICASAMLHSTSGITSLFLNTKTVTTSNTVRIEQGAPGTGSVSYSAYATGATPVVSGTTTVNGVTCT